MEEKVMELVIVVVGLGGSRPWMQMCSQQFALEADAV